MSREMPQTPTTYRAWREWCTRALGLPRRSPGGGGSKSGSNAGRWCAAALRHRDLRRGEAVAHPHEKYRRLIERCKALEAVPCAVVHPCDETSLRGALAAGREGLIVPILVGPERKIRSLATEYRLNLDGVEIVDAPHSDAAAEMAVALARN